MVKYQIITESTGDLTPALIAELGVTVLPMQFNLDGASYRNYPDGRDLSPADFYAKLRAGATCTTSQVSMADYHDAFTPVLAGGQDILYLSFSSGLSGTCQAANLAAQEMAEQFPDRRVLVVDSLQASMGEGLFVYLVARKAKRENLDLDAAAAYAKDLAPKVCAWFTVNDLMFLKRGGRLSGAAAVAGTLLGIKPVLHVDDEGHLIAMEKVRGRRASLDALLKHYETTVSDKNETVFISHGDCAADCAYVIDKLKALGVKEIYQGDIGPVIGAHSGPGTVALFWVGTKR